MKNLLISAAILLSAFGANSQENDWMVGTILNNGAKVVYEVLPATVEMSIQPELVLYTVVVEMTDIDSEETGRRRLFVTGCDKGTGKATFTNMDGTRNEGTPVFEWDKSGNRVYDALSIMTCAAYMLKMQKRSPDVDAPAPTKPKPKSGLIV